MHAQISAAGNRSRRQIRLVSIVILLDFKNFKRAGWNFFQPAPDPIPIQGPMFQGTQSLGGLASQHLKALTPRVRTDDRVGIDVPPVTGIPRRADGPDDSVHVLDVRDVRVAIDTEQTFLSLALGLDCPVELGQFDGPLLGPELSHDFRVAS